MHRLVRKTSPSHLYKKSGHLVRTPITVTLQPSEMAVYQVAGTYTSNNFPNSGFIEQNTYNNVVQMGYDCLQAYLNHSDSRQIWRNVNTSHLPETCWYQGAFATSAPNIASTYSSCEAYLQLGAYKFTAPSGLAELSVTSAKVKFTNGGAIVCYQSAGNGSNNNILWKNSTVQDKSFYIQFAAGASLGHCQTIAGYSSTSIDIATQGGTPRGAHDLWGFSGTTRDGGIPTFTTSTTNELVLNANTTTSISNNIANGVWIIPFINATVSSTSYYRPQYLDSRNGYWGCASVWGLTLEVEFD